jgi:hypothetical protein
MQYFTYSSWTKKSIVIIDVYENISEFIYAKLTHNHLITSDLYLYHSNISYASTNSSVKRKCVLLACLAMRRFNFWQVGFTFFTGHEGP